MFETRFFNSIEWNFEYFCFQPTRGSSNGYHKRIIATLGATDEDVEEKHGDQQCL